MRLLVDTHVFLWWVADDARLSPTSRTLLANPDNLLYFSTASSWEIAIKHSLGKLALPELPERWLPMQLLENGLASLPILDAHAFRTGRLPAHHKDPFDRLLVAQAQVEGLTLLSDDPWVRLYDVAVAT